MSLANPIITLNIQNNNNYAQEISVLGNPYNPLDTVNAKTEYRWDLTGFVFTNEDTVSVQYRGINETLFQTYISGLQAQTLESVVVALNGLQIGFFNLYTELGLTFIGTYNENYVFGDLNLFNTTLLNPAFSSGSGFNGIVNVVNNNFIGGNFNIYNGNGVGQNITLLNNNGSLNGNFSGGGGFNNSVLSIATQTDSKILVGGDFTDYDGNSRNYIIRLNTDGSIDNTFVIGTGFDNNVLTIAIQTDGKILCGGNFTDYDGTPANFIIRLNSDGSVDGTFVYGTGFDTFPINTIYVQNDSKILCLGTFTDYNGTPANNVIRLNSDGSVDSTFVYGTGFDTMGTSSVLEIANGNLIIGSSFTSYNGTTANRIIRLNSDGSINTNWDIGSGFNGQVLSIAYPIGSTSSVLVGGNFTTFDGITANYIANLLL
jgi:uncharacterized delta-60 repeat protein